MCQCKCCIMAKLIEYLLVILMKAVVVVVVVVVEVVLIVDGEPPPNMFCKQPDEIGITR